MHEADKVRASYSLRVGGAQTHTDGKGKASRVLLCWDEGGVVVCQAWNVRRLECWPVVCMPFITPQAVLTSMSDARQINIP